VLYMHSKGVTNPMEVDPIRDWIALLLYFNVILWEGIPEILEKDYVVSCPNFFTSKVAPPHCSGNFWWARGDYVAKLPVLEQNVERHEWEFWIGTLLRVPTQYKACIVWPNAVDHYSQKFYPIWYFHIKKAECMRVWPDCSTTPGVTCDDVKIKI